MDLTSSFLKEFYTRFDILYNIRSYFQHKLEVFGESKINLLYKMLAIIIL